MNIIIEPENLDDFRNKFTVLTLDTIRILPENRLVTAYCVIENMPIAELATVDNKRNLHENLMINYRKRDWNYCTQAIDYLIGAWGGEADSFYMDLKSRIDKYIEQDPGEDWDGIIEKYTTNQ